MSERVTALAGVRIADFSRVLVGPICTRILATLGAEVIRVEWRKRPDQFRRFEPYLGERHIDHAGQFHALNYSKQSLELDLTRPWGVQAGLDLIARSDVVIENFRAGQFASMGFTPEAIARANPEAIYIGIGGLGQSGPERSYVAYGNSLHAYSGLVAISGYPGEEGRGIAGTWADPVSGLFAATALLAALVARREGRLPGPHTIDQSMLDCLLTTLPEGVIAAQVEPERARPAGNRSPLHTPQGVLPALGEDRWVAFSVQSYVQFRGLIALAELRGYDDPALFSIPARRRIEERLLAALACWSRELAADDLVCRLREAGIAAGIVSHAGDLAGSAEFAQRGFMRSIRVAPDAERRHPGVPWTSSHPDSLVFAPPPALGEHSRAVMRDVLGYADEQIEELLARLEE
ncbi:MAG TPA: CaiB/BaiF CoA-transferase family protein [Dehalococcoidia bacterium]|nr:CaiB/BaiF CoA-transferase family protein [Dehalococcoidia bacterium]